MSEPTADRQLDQAVDRLAHLLTQYGMNPKASKEASENARERILVSTAGAIRTSRREGGLHLTSSEEPLEALAAELYRAAPGSAKLNSDAIEEPEEQPEVTFEQYVAHKRAVEGYGF